MNRNTVPAIFHLQCGPSSAGGQRTLWPNCDRTIGSDRVGSVSPSSYSKLGSKSHDNSEAISQLGSTRQGAGREYKCYAVKNLAKPCSIEGPKEEPRFSLVCLKLRNNCLGAVYGGAEGKNYTLDAHIFGGSFIDPLVT